MIEIFNLLLVHPIINLLVAIYHLLVSVGLPYPLGFSIIVLTCVIRIIIYPLMHSQLSTSKKMQDLSPHLSKLKEKHKNDAKTLQQETMKLYKEFGVNPAAGCLPVLIQLPLIWALYGVLQHIVNQKPAEVLGYINGIVYTPSLRLTHIWDTSFFGIPLGKHPSDLLSAMPFIVLIPVITALLQFVQSKMMAPALPADHKQKQDDFAAMFQSQTLFMMPLMLGFLSYTLPVGLSLYWNTFTIFGILQQYQIAGLGGLANWKKRFIK